MRSSYHMIPPSDIDVRGVKLPAVKNRDLRDFLQYRLRSLYPGNRDLTAFDYLLHDSGDSREAFLCICRSDVLASHQAAAKGRKLIVPLSLLMPVLASYRKKKLGYLFFGAGSIEVDLFEDCHLVSSTVLKRDETGRFDSGELATILQRFDTDAVYAVMQNVDDRTAFEKCEDLKDGSRELKVSQLDSAFSGLGKRYSLFQVSRSGNRMLSRVALPLMLVIVLVRRKRFSGSNRFPQGLTTNWRWLSSRPNVPHSSKTRQPSCANRLKRSRNGRTCSRMSFYRSSAAYSAATSVSTPLCSKGISFRLKRSLLIRSLSCSGSKETST